MDKRGDNILAITAFGAVVAALIFLPDWQSFKEQAVRLAHWQIYGR